MEAAPGMYCPSRGGPEDATRFELVHRAFAEPGVDHLRHASAQQYTGLSYPICTFGGVLCCHQNLGGRRWKANSGWTDSRSCSSAQGAAETFRMRTFETSVRKSGIVRAARCPSWQPGIKGKTMETPGTGLPCRWNQEVRCDSRFPPKTNTREALVTACSERDLHEDSVHGRVFIKPQPIEPLNINEAAAHAKRRFNAFVRSRRRERNFLD